MSFLLIGHGWLFAAGRLAVPLPLRLVLGLGAGLCIGVVSSLLGVAGGELIISTLVLLFALDIKVAGSVSLAISFPTILVGLARYRSRPIFAQVPAHRSFIAFMALGSLVGAWAGSRLVAYIPGASLQVVLGVILLASALQMLRKHPGVAAVPVESRGLTLRRRRPRAVHLFECGAGFTSLPFFNFRAALGA